MPAVPTSVAAVGAGLEVAIDVETDHYEGPGLVAGFAVPLPVRAPVHLTALALVALVAAVQVAKSRGASAGVVVSAANGPPS